MNITDCYLYVQDRLNKLSSNNSQNIQFPQFIRAFNTSQLQWVEDRIKINESSNLRTDEISQLLTSVKLNTSIKENFYEATKPSDYFHFKRLYGTPCNINIIPVKEADVNNLLKSSNWKPSLEWEETFATFVGNKIRIYKDETFNLTGIYLVYFRYPLDVDIAGYTKYNGSVSTSIDPEFQGSSLVEILDMTCLLLASDINDQLRYQVMTNKTTKHN